MNFPQPKAAAGVSKDMTLHDQHRQLVQQRDATVRRFDSDIEDLERQMKNEAHEEGLRRSPKWAAMNENQRSYCHFMGIDPDEPDVPSD